MTVTTAVAMGAWVLVLSSLLALASSDFDSASLRAEPSLVRVFIAFRHGSRAPSFATYPNDTHNKDNEQFWPAGAGELTKNGKQEAFELGQKLRVRYNDFLGDYYRPKEFKVFSTIKERTIMSGQLAVAALFPPKDYQQWNSGLNWQPIPVIPDYVINRTDDINCPMLLVSSKAEMQKYPASVFGLNEKDITLLETQIGPYGKDPFNFMSKLWDVWDTIYFQDKEGISLLNWIKALYPDKMSNAILKFVLFYLSGSHTRKMILIAPYGKALADFFTDSHRKMELHAWHDMNMVGLMTLLGIDIEEYPGPTSSVAIELHNKNGEHLIEVYYYSNSKATKPKLMRMPCGTSCGVSELTKLFHNYGQKNFETLCDIKENVDDTFKIPPNAV